MKHMKEILALSLILVLFLGVLLPAYGEEATADDEYAGKVIVACVGDSITKGIGTDGKPLRNYPTVLGELLGDDYAVINYGNPGATLQDEGSRPYTSLPEYQASLDMAAQVYIIMLGTNDSVEGVWDAARYEQQLGEKVDTYLAAGEHPLVYLMTSPQTYVREGKDKVISGIRTEVINDEICPIIKKVAEEKGINVIDLNKFTVDHADWFADGVHPNEDGYAEVAQFVFEAIQPGLETLEG